MKIKVSYYKQASELVKILLDNGYKNVNIIKHSKIYSWEEEYEIEFAPKVEEDSKGENKNGSRP